MDVIADTDVYVRNSGFDSTLKVLAGQDARVYSTGDKSLVDVKSDNWVIVQTTGSYSTLDVDARTNVRVFDAGEGSEITGTYGTTEDVRNLQRIKDKSATVNLTQSN